MSRTENTKTPNTPADTKQHDAIQYQTFALLMRFEQHMFPISFCINVLVRLSTALVALVLKGLHSARKIVNINVKDRNERLPRLPASVWAEHILPYVANRHVWNALVESNKEIHQGGRRLVQKRMQEVNTNHLEWPVGKIHSRGNLPPTIGGSKEAWTAITFTKPQGTYLVAALESGRLVVWHRLLGDLGQFPDKCRRIHALAASPTEEGLVAGAITTQEGDPAVALWSLGCNNEDGSLVEASPTRRLFGHTDKILCLSFSPDGRYLASGSVDGSVCLWHVETGTLRCHLLQSTFVALTAIYQVMIRPGCPSKMVVEAILGYKGRVAWDVGPWVELDTAAPINIQVFPVFYDMPYLTYPQCFCYQNVIHSTRALGSCNGLIYIRPLQGPEFVCAYGEGAIRKLSFCDLSSSSNSTERQGGDWNRQDVENDEQAACGLISYSKGYYSLRIWKILISKTGNISHRFSFCCLQGHESPVVDFCQHDDRWLASAAADGSLCVWDLKDLPPFEYCRLPGVSLGVIRGYNQSPDYNIL